MFDTEYWQWPPAALTRVNSLALWQSDELVDNHLQNVAQPHNISCFIGTIENVLTRPMAIPRLSRAISSELRKLRWTLLDFCSWPVRCTAIGCECECKWTGRLVGLRMLDNYSHILYAYDFPYLFPPHFPTQQCGASFSSLTLLSFPCDGLTLTQFQHESRTVAPRRIEVPQTTSPPETYPSIDARLCWGTC